MEDELVPPPDQPVEQPSVVVTPKAPMRRRMVATVFGVVAIVGILVFAAGVWAYQYVHQRVAVAPDARQQTVLTTAGPSQTPTNVSASTVITNIGLAHSAPIDATKIPLGDGKVSTSAKVGYVYSCQTSFGSHGGAAHAGDWIQGDTWDSTQKIAVQGNVSWPNAVFSAVAENMKRLLSGNGLPVNSGTGNFPIAQSDPASQYDRNPNSIKEQTVAYQIPANPTISSTPTCVPMGVVGYAINGVAIYNALDADGRDAVAHEVQDSCDGHPQEAGEYHYHGPSKCMPNINENAQLVGYALDGFGIYSLKDKNGNEYTNADLDECHGITGEIEWNGKTVTMYHYVLTREYPYTISCFRGTPVTSHNTVSNASSAGGDTVQQPQSATSGPPQAAVVACDGKSTGSNCSFSGGQGTVSGTCRMPPTSSTLACIPQ